jgi:hypothetical protein
MEHILILFHEHSSTKGNILNSIFLNSSNFKDVTDDMSGR